MEKLEELYLESIDVDDVYKSIRLIKQVAIDFSLWQQRGECNWVLNDEDEWIDSYAGVRITTEELFDEFLKTYEL